MKTFIIDLDCLDSQIFSSLIGFIHSRGYPFRKLDLISNGKTGKCLFVETQNKAEKELLLGFLDESGISSPIVVENSGKAKLKAKSIGEFSEVTEVGHLASFYLDKLTGRRYTIAGGI